MLGAIFIPFFYFHHVLIFLNLNLQFRKIRIFGYFLTAVAFVFCFTPHFVRGVSPRVGFKYWPDPGILFGPFLLIWFLYVIGGVFLIWKSYISAEGNRRNQLKYVLVATLVGWIGGATNYPLWFGLNILPMGNILVSVYISIVAYAIVKHQLLDIEIIFRRATVFAGLFAFVYGMFSLVTIVGQEVFHKYFGWNQWLSTIPTVFIITFTLRPLENLLTNATEKFLFQKKYDYRDLLKTFTNEVLTVLDLQKLTEQTVLGLNKIIKLESASILLFDKDSKIFKLATAIGIKDKAQSFAENDAIASYLKQTHEPILRDKSTDDMHGHSSLRDDFKKLNARLCLPIAHHDELIGILSLGMKKSGGEFTEEDIDILSTLAKTLAIAIANAQLFDQLSKTQAEAAQREKMAVIGTLAAGINHEICNPLGIVRGQCEMFLLNLRDGLYEKKTKEDMSQIAAEIMNKVIRETDRATAITKKLSGFAKPAKKVDNEEVFVEKEADEVMGLLGHDLRLNNIAFKKEFAQNFPHISADRRQIQEVLFNIIRNAAQAMDKDNKDAWISLSGSTENGSVVIKIADNGSGIPADKIGQIFNPFFTTKEPGKGTGLGLFIVKQVIERNKGTIAVDSNEGVGTTFTLTFPVGEQAKVLAA